MLLRRRWPRPTPGVVGFAVAGAGWVVVSTVIVNGFAAAVLLVTGMALVVPRCLAHHTTRRAENPVTMATMVGGTAGGFVGGVATAIVGIPGAQTAMALMTASMVGMVGGVLGGGLRDWL